MEFDIQNGKIRVKPETLMLAELRTIWESDDSVQKEMATDLLTYIHLVAQVDEKAPLFNAKFDEVEELAKGNIWYRKDCPFDLNGEYVKVAITAYQKSKEEPDIRSLKIFNKKIDQLIVMVENMTPEIKEKQDRLGNFTGYVTNAPMITKVMQDLAPLMNARDELKNRIKKESEEQKKFRGGRKQNILERKLLRGTNEQSVTTQQSGADSTRD